MAQHSRDGSRKVLNLAAAPKPGVPQPSPHSHCSCSTPWRWQGMHDEAAGGRDQRCAIERRWAVRLTRAICQRETRMPGKLIKTRMVNERLYIQKSIGKQGPLGTPRPTAPCAQRSDAVHQRAGPPFLPRSVPEAGRGCPSQVLPGVRPGRRAFQERFRTQGPNAQIPKHDLLRALQPADRPRQPKPPPHNSAPRGCLHTQGLMPRPPPPTAGPYPQLVPQLLLTG